MFNRVIESSGRPLIMPRRVLAAVAIAAGMLLAAADASACSVCQGNPDSNLVKGAEAGVLFMVLVTYGLLMGMAALCVSWFVRQRRRLAGVGAVASGGDDALV